MVAKSTQGSKISYAVQTAFGTPNTTGMKDIRLEGEPSFETPVSMGVTPEAIGANAFENEKPITEKMASDAAFVATSLVRQAATAGSDSFLATAFKAAGCEVDTITADTTTSGTPTVGVIPATSTAGMAPGVGVNIELDDGTWIPTLIGDVSGSDVIPVMALPSAPSAGKAINKSFTVTPGKMDKVVDTTLLTMIAANKAGGAQGDDCALTAIGDMVFNPGEKIPVEYTFGTTNKTRIDTEMVGSNDFADGLAAMIVHQPYAQFTDSSTDYTTALTAAYHKVIDATVSFGITSEQVPGYGDTNCVNNVQAWMQVGENARLTITMLYESDKLSDFDGDNDSKYISIIQPGKSELDPAVGFFMPNAHIAEPPEWEPYGNNHHRVTVTYVPRPPSMDSGDTSSDQDNQPWYLIVGDRSA